jgi:hypothetical protein
MAFLWDSRRKNPDLSGVHTQQLLRPVKASSEPLPTGVPASKGD